MRREESGNRREWLDDCECNGAVRRIILLFIDKKMESSSKQIKLTPPQRSDGKWDHLRSTLTSGTIISLPQLPCGFPKELDQQERKPSGISGRNDYQS